MESKMQILRFYLVGQKDAKLVLLVICFWDETDWLKINVESISYIEKPMLIDLRLNNITDKISWIGL